MSNTGNMEKCCDNCTERVSERDNCTERVSERDHRDIGLQNDLFFFDEVCAGSAFFLPDGAIIYNRLMKMLRSEYRKRDFKEVITPQVCNKSLWEKSGHWEKYKENMFILENDTDNDDNTKALKAMNCPLHCLIFKHRVRSYKELPLRLADFGVLHRNEASGALSGLTRVRKFSQDDCHFFCSPDQINSEITNCLEFLDKVYSKFGFTYEVGLSTRPEKYIGELDVWNNAEKQLEDVLQKSGKKYEINKGDGAFYGPKIDIQLMTGNGKKLQCATIQLDFQLPQRFELEYTDQNGKHVRPVMIHRAIFGSFERFIAILCETFEGKFPFWLSPRQVMVLPIADRHMDYANYVKKTIMEGLEEIRYDELCIDVDRETNTLNKKILNAVKYNYILVVGDKEVKDKTVNVRFRDGKNKVMSIGEFVALIKVEC